MTILRVINKNKIYNYYGRGASSYKYAREPDNIVFDIY